LKKKIKKIKNKAKNKRMRRNPKTVVVIGGGIVGLSTAYRLGLKGVQRGLDVRIKVLERDSIFSGASGCSLGGLWPSKKHLHKKNRMNMNMMRGGGGGGGSGDLLGLTQNDLHQTSLELFPNFIEELEKVSSLKVNYRRNGALEILEGGGRGNERYKRIGGRPNENNEEDVDEMEGFRFLSSKEIQQRFPTIDSTSVPFGALFHDSSAQVEMASLKWALLDACNQLKNIEILEQTTVTNILYDSQNNMVREVITKPTSSSSSSSSSPTHHHGDLFLLSAGAWTTSLLPPSLKEQVKIRPSKGQAVSIQLTPPHPSSSSSSSSSSFTPISTLIPQTIIRRGKHYLIPWDDILLIGSSTEPEAGFDLTVNPSTIADFLSFAKELLPCLRPQRLPNHSNNPFQVLREWSGLRPQSVLNPPYHRGGGSPIMSFLSTSPLPSSSPSSPSPSFSPPSPSLSSPSLRSSSFHCSNLFVASGHFKTGVGWTPLLSDLLSSTLLEDHHAKKAHELLMNFSISI
jgi:glycine/D-amino acid oxidase-like deaminating enzyme